MKRPLPTTCHELLKKLQNLQQRFGLFFETKRFTPELSWTDKIAVFQGYLEESERLRGDVLTLKEKFVPPEVQRLLGNLEKQYDAAKDMALEFSPGVEIPSKEFMMEKIRELGTEKLKEIAKFGKPTLLMTPPTSMAGKQKVLNKKKRYPEQADADFGEGEYVKDELWNPKPEGLTVSIVDGLPTLPQLPDEILKDKKGEFTHWDFRYKKIYEQFKAKNMHMITAHEYAILMQLSLMKYEKAKNDLQHVHHKTPEQEIVDFTTNESWTVTAFYQPENVLRNLQKVPFGFFSSRYRMVCFTWNAPDNDYVSLRARGAVQVFSL